MNTVKTPLLVGLFAHAVLAIGSAEAAPSYLELTSINGGDTSTVGAGFVGSLLGGAVTVTGSLSGSATHFSLFDPSNSGQQADSRIDNTSPQYGYASIYTPAEDSVDQIGYGNNLDAAFAATRLNITFSEAVTDLTFHVANLGGSVFDFSNTSGLNSLTLLSGNGSAVDNDGLSVSGKIILDLDSNTEVGQALDTAPFTEGTPRSGYGSVLLAGTYSSLAIDIYTNPSAIWHFDTDGSQDGGSFTLSAAPVPVPAAVWLFGSAVAGLGLLGKRRKAA